MAFVLPELSNSRPETETPYVPFVEPRLEVMLDAFAARVTGAQLYAGVLGVRAPARSAPATQTSVTSIAAQRHGLGSRAQRRP